MEVHDHSRMRLQARSLTCGSQDSFTIDFWICLFISQMPKQAFNLDFIDHSQQHTNLDFGPFSSIHTPTSHAGFIPPRIGRPSARLDYTLPEL
jgi:hypothetical protein